MNFIASINPRKLERTVPWCDRCALRSGCGFEDFTHEELSFMMDFKVGHGRAWAGETIMDAGVVPLRCYTLFSGWAVRCRPLERGQRHVLSILLPGDPIGLQGALCGVSSDVFEAVTDVTYCVFDVSKMKTLLSTGSLGERMTKLLAWENLQLANRLAITGACSARTNLAHLIYELYLRLEQRKMTRAHTFKLPMSLKQLAEVVGLTPVHLHRVLKALQKDGVLAIEQKTVFILDIDKLATYGASWSLPVVDAPFF